MVSSWLLGVSIALISFVLLSILIYTIQTGITPTPTTRKVKDEVICLSQHFSPTQVAELGAGWGTMVFAYAKAFPNATITAFEMSLVPYLFMKLRQQLTPYENVVIKKRNFFHEELISYDLLFCYLYPGAMRKLRTHLTDHTPTQTIVISNTFTIMGWHPIFSQSVSQWLSPSTIYVYDTSKNLD